MNPSTAILDDLSDWLHFSVSRDSSWWLAPAAWTRSDYKTVVGEVRRRFDLSDGETRALLDAFRARCETQQAPPLEGDSVKQATPWRGMGGPSS